MVEKAHQPCCARGPTTPRVHAAGGDGGDCRDDWQQRRLRRQGADPDGKAPLVLVRLASLRDGDGGNDDDDEGWHAPCGAVGTESGTEINDAIKKKRRLRLDVLLLVTSRMDGATPPTVLRSGSDNPAGAWRPVATSTAAMGTTATTGGVMDYAAASTLNGFARQ